MNPHQTDSLPDGRLRSLVFRAKHGDVEAFGELYDNLYDRVYSYAHRRSYDQSAAQDIAANTFYKIMTNMTQFKWHDEARFYAWVFRIARHELARYFRDANRYQTYEDWLSVSDTISDERDSRHDELERSERDTALHKAIADLPSKQREVVELYYFAGASHEVIANTLKIRPGAARTRLHRALNALEESMKGGGYA